MNFLNKLDQVYQENRTACAIPENQTDYNCFIPVEITDGAYAERFIVWKGAKSKLMLPCGKQRVYLTDEQIVETICAMGAEDARWYLSQFVRLYRDEGQQIYLKIGVEEFEMKGIGPCPEEKGLYLPSDTLISHRQFCYLLSFIFEKDARWEEMHPKYFGKKTLVKFILLVDWLCNNGPYSKKVLQKLRYPLEDSSSNDRNKRKTFEREKSIEIMKTTFDISEYL